MTTEPKSKKKKTTSNFDSHQNLNETKETLFKKWTKVNEDNLNIHYTTIFNRDIRDDYFNRLEEEVEYLTGTLAEVKVYGKVHKIPRQHSAYGVPGLKYKYSGTTVPAKPWTPTLKILRDIIEVETGFLFNFVLVNRYKDGDDKMGDHKDDEKELAPDFPIVSLSLGADRDFVFKHQDRKLLQIPPVKILLTSGTLLMMFPPTNKYWYHGLPSRKTCKQPRINLTFRKILN